MDKHNGWHRQITMDSKDRIKFLKIVHLMRSSTEPGEKEAAELAAKRLADGFGLSVDDAVRVALGKSEYERVIPSAADEGPPPSSKTDIDDPNWAEDRRIISSKAERARKAAWRQSREEAIKRGLETQKTAGKPQPTKRFSARSKFRPSRDDNFRLVSGLLRDGMSVERIAALLNFDLKQVKAYQERYEELRKSNLGFGQRGYTRFQAGSR